MTTAEFLIDLDEDNEGVGTVIITDAQLLLLVRPAVSRQYPPSVKHDSTYAYRILNLGNDMGMYYQWHIICQGDPRTAYQLLDRVFYAYVEACCLALWCDANACYIVDGKTVLVKGYGFKDGQYTMVFNVYCGIAKGQTEEFVAALTADQADNFVVIQPDSSAQGFSVHGFAVEQPDENDTDYDEDEDPLAGDVEPTGGYYEPAEQRP